jgi:hypothetical protein
VIRLARYALFLVCAVQFCLAIAFFLQLPFAVGLWPFPGTTPLTLILVSSFLAAAGASTLWATLSKTYGALAGIGLDYLAVLLPLSTISFRLGAGLGNPQLTTFGMMCVFAVVFGLALLVWGIRTPIDGTVPMPHMVRWSFVIFILALLIEGSRLLWRVPNAIPWTITPDLSFVIGWMFLGAATYFAYALARPSWLNSAGQLAGFLAYDVVLIVPFLTRLPTVASEHKAGLIVYTVVVIYSGLLAIYYLFIRETTRVWTRVPRRGAPSP